MLVRQIVDHKLAQFAYLIGCPRTGEAIIIDPERDVDRYFEVAAQHRLRLVAAADTHIHADYLSGLPELAERDLMIYASREGGPDWQYEWLTGSRHRYRLLGHHDRFMVGNVEFMALHTPGHTPEHLSYLVRDAGSGVTDPIALASGDFVFVGDVGRPDLLERAAGAIGVMEPAARTLYASIQREFKTLPEFVQVWPGHGAGSACGKSLGDIPASTVGYELRTNPSILAASDESAFVRFILSGQPEPPPYFARMKRENRIGPRILRTIPTPPHLDGGELQSLINRQDVVVLDTRRSSAFVAGHLGRSILADLDFQFCTIAGSYVEDDQPVYLIVEEERLQEAVLALVRIGVDRIEGYVTPAALDAFRRAGGTLTRSEVVDFETLEDRRIRGTHRVLDVRSQAEFDLGHVPDAIHIAHTRLLVNLVDLPRDRPIVVHCRTGARAAAAVSLLERHGYRVATVSDLFANYHTATPSFKATA
jgi:hydroxyacylglutathione hydrolase